MSWLEKCKSEAMKLSKEKRQEFLDLMWKGKTIGEATKETGVTADESTGIMMLNIATHKYLRSETV